MTDIPRAKIQELLEKLGKDKIIHQANLNGVEGAIGILTMLLQEPELPSEIPEAGAELETE